MFQVNGYNVKLTRGDNATLAVALDGYETQEGDVLTLSAKSSVSATEYLFQLEAAGDVFTFLPETTAGLPFGSYVYDIQLTTSAGEVYTVIPVSAFVILEEVTCASEGE